MNISKTHEKFSKLLNNPRVLSNPEEFLGQNFEAVLNYWLILDDLSEVQWRTIKGRYRDFYDNQWSEWCKASNEAIKASKETIGSKFADKAAWAAFNVYGSGGGATRELIGMHKFFDQQKPLTFFEMFLNL